MIVDVVFLSQGWVWCALMETGSWLLQDWLKMCLQNAECCDCWRGFPFLRMSMVCSHGNKLMLVERVTLRTEGHLNFSGYIPEISSIKEVWLGINEKKFSKKIPERSKWLNEVCMPLGNESKGQYIILIILGNATLRGYNSSLRLLSQMIQTLTTLNRCAKNLEDSINIWLGDYTWHLHLANLEK